MPLPVDVGGVVVADAHSSLPLFLHAFLQPAVDVLDPRLAASVDIRSRMKRVAQQLDENGSRRIFPANGTILVYRLQR